MLRSYVTTAIRNLARDPFGNAISVVGMSAGFTSCLLIALYVEDEWQYESMAGTFKSTLSPRHPIGWSTADRS